jgi:hypothetical protein
MSDRKRLREELQAEFADLEEFGVTQDEIEALMEQCGLPPRRSRIFNTGEARHDIRTEEASR